MRLESLDFEYDFVQGSFAKLSYEFAVKEGVAALQGRFNQLEQYLDERFAQFLDGQSSLPMEKLPKGTATALLMRAGFGYHYPQGILARGEAAELIYWVMTPTGQAPECTIGLRNMHQDRREILVMHDELLMDVTEYSERASTALVRMNMLRRQTTPQRYLETLLLA